MRAAGRTGYETSIRGDIELAQRLFERAQSHPELRAGSINLSIATFRYVPPEVDESDTGYLNELNKRLLARIQASGELYVSNAVVNDVYFLRACVVNFRSSADDIDAIIDRVVAMGRSIRVGP